MSTFHALLQILEMLRLLKLLEYWAPLNDNPRLRGTRCQRAVVELCAPPLQVLAFILQSEEQQHAHEGRPCIQGCGKDVVVFLPPALVVLEHKVVEDRPGD